MTTPISVRVAGETYTVSTISELALFPLLKVFGSDIAPEDKNSKAYQKWQARFLGRFSDPINQASVAYSIRNIIPELPESVVKYNLYRREDGDYYVDFALNISAMDLLALVTAIEPLLMARKDEIEGKKTVQPMTVGDRGQPIVGKSILLHDPSIEEQRTQLQAQLAALEAVTES